MASVSNSIDVSSIVGQLMTLERRPLTALAQQQARATAQVSAWGSLKGALSALESAAQSLRQPERYEALRASSSDPTVGLAAAGSGAVPGSHALEVSALAQQHRIATGALAGPAVVVGTGTLQFQFGTYESGGNSFAINPDKPAASVAIGPGQQTLAGIRDAVNAAAIGVSASLVNDGTGTRLVFTSTGAGAASSLRIAVVDADGSHTDTGGLSALAYEPTAAAGSGKNLAQVAEARDAQFRVDGVALTRATNTIQDAIDGVTVTLVKTGASTISIARDTGAVRLAVQEFVKAYNDASRAVDGLTRYDAKTRQAGMLQGDSVASSITTRLRGSLTETLAGLAGGLTSLSQIGVALQKDGTLGLDAAKLDAALTGEGAADIKRLFACTGRSTCTYNKYAGFSEATRAGTYAVHVTQYATRGTLAGSAPAGLTVTAGVNDSLSFTVDGQQASVTLAAGTYASASALAAEMQSKVNGDAALASAGAAVTVTASGGTLTVTSNRYGSASRVVVDAGAARDQWFGGGAIATDGVDAAGTINGMPATGTGAVLSGPEGSAAEGLRVETHPAGVPDFTVGFSRGHADRMLKLAEGLLGASGGLAARTSGLEARLKTLSARERDLNARLADVEQRYRQQYVALDTLLQRMGSTSSYLTAQLARIDANNS